MKKYCITSVRRLSVSRETLGAIPIFFHFFLFWLISKPFPTSKTVIGIIDGIIKLDIRIQPRSSQLGIFICKVQNEAGAISILWLYTSSIIWAPCFILIISQIEVFYDYWFTNLDHKYIYVPVLTTLKCPCVSCNYHSKVVKSQILTLSMYLLVSYRKSLNASWLWVHLHSFSSYYKI